MNTVEVLAHEHITEPSWILHVEPFIQKVLEQINITDWEVSILFCNDDFIQKLNAEFRKIDAPTDVLSFEQGDEYINDEGQTVFYAGDIVISLDSLQKNCDDFDVPFADELKRLLIHGILHLNGFDHSDNSPEQPMLVFQEELLKKEIIDECFRQIIR